MVKNKAFTIIELVVVIGIILTVTGVGVTRYKDFTQDKKLNSDVRSIYEMMTLASKRATTGVSGAVASCTDYQGVRMTLTTSGSVTYQNCCEVACNSAQSTTYSTYQTQSGISLIAPTATTTYLFNKLGQSITINPTANQTITLRNASISRCISITVNPSGLVSTQNEISC